MPLAFMLISAFDHNYESSQLITLSLKGPQKFLENSLPKKGIL